MAKANESAKTGAKKTGKKASKAKWLLFLIALIVIASGVGYYFGFDKPFFAFIKKSGLMDMLDRNQETNVIEPPKIDELSVSMIELEKDRLAAEAERKKQIKSTQKKYYIKVEDCINVTCEQEVIRFLKREKLPYTRRLKKQKTKYFELVSESVYTRLVAKAKIDQLKMETEIIGDPYLVKENNRYRISLGQFPREDTVVRIKAELAHLYPKLKMDFELQPKEGFYNVKSIYSGPFEKSVAHSVLKKLQDNPEYETSEITQKL
jgi:hypothetical protein